MMGSEHGKNKLKMFSTIVSVARGIGNLLFSTELKTASFCSFSDVEITFTLGLVMISRATTGYKPLESVPVLTSLSINY